MASHSIATATTLLASYVVIKTGLGRVTVPMSKSDCEAYIAGAEANGGTGYTIARFS